MSRATIRGGYPRLRSQILLKKCVLCEKGSGTTSLMGHPVCKTCLNKLGENDRLLNVLKIIIKEI